MNQDVTNINIMSVNQVSLALMSAEEQETLSILLSSKQPELYPLFKMFVESSGAKPRRDNVLTVLINELLGKPEYDIVLIGATRQGGAIRQSNVVKSPQNNIIQQKTQSTSDVTNCTATISNGIVQIGKIKQRITNGNIECSGMNIIGPIYKPLSDGRLHLGNYDHTKLVGLKYNIPELVQYIFDNDCVDIVLSILNKSDVNEKYVRSSGIYYYQLAVARKPQFVAYKINSEITLVADEFIEFNKLLHCRIGKNYDGAFIADLQLRGINILKPDITKLRKMVIADNLRRKTSEKIKTDSAMEVIFQQAGSKVYGTNWQKTFTNLGTSFKDRLSKLPTTQKTKIEQEIKQQTDYVKMITTSTCEHIALYSKLRAAKTTPDIKTAFANIQPYITSPTSKSGRNDSQTMIPCTKCGVPFICPHLILMLELIIARKSQLEIASAIYPYKRDDSRVSYCKICNEILTTVDYTELHNVIDTDLSKFIYSEVSYILHKVQFPALTQMSSVYRGIINKIYPYIYEIDKKLSKNKLALQSEIANKKRLYIAIYTYAVLANTVTKDIYFKNFKYNTTVELFKQMIADIMYSYNNVIKQIPQMNVDSIKNILVEAHRETTGKVAIKTTVSELIQLMEGDDMYQYTQLFWHGKSMEYILGESFTNKSSTNLFGSIKQPNTIPQPLIKSKWWKHLPYVVDQRHLQIDSFRLICEFLRTNLYRQNMFVNVGIDKQTQLALVDFSPDHKKYNSELTKLLVLESQYLDIWRANYAKNYTVLKSTPPTAYPLGGMPFIMARIYDSNGKEHKWKNGVCTVCGEKLVDETIDKNKLIADIVKLNHDIDNFYLYYQVQCPEGGLHDGIPCTKCGFSGRDPAYYEKYVSIYNTRNRIIASDIISTDDVIPIKEKLLIKYDFDESLSDVIAVADLLKINRKHLESIGMTEGIQYDLIKSGNYIPPQPEYNVDTQIYNIFSRIMYLIYEYNILKNYFNVGKDNPLAAFVHKEKIEKYIMYDIGPNLPNIYDDFNEKFEYFKQTRKPRDLQTWLIREFCNKLLIIHNTVTTAAAAQINAQTIKIQKAFFFYICKKIIRSDEMLTKRGWFNMALLYGDTGDAPIKSVADETTTESTADDNNPFDVSDFDMEDGFNEDGEDVVIQMNNE